MRRVGIASLLVAVLAGPALVGRAWAAEPITLHMEGWWGGMQAADILLTVDQGAEGHGQDDWDGRLVVHTAGMIKWLTGLVADARGRGRIDGDGAFPASYLQHVKSRKSDRTVEVGFTGNPPLGMRVKDLETFADPSKQARDAENVPDLPEDQRRGTIDPIAAILSLGSRALAGEHKFTLPVYDGRRRFDLEVAVLGHGKHGLNGQPTTTLDAVAIMHPIGGFKPFHAKWWNNAKFEVLLDPKSGLPLQISSSSFVAAVVLTTHAICPPDPACALPGAN
jgi:hypothetical protein